MKISSSKAVIFAAAFTLATSFSLSIHAHTLKDVVQETVSTNPDVQITAKVKRASNEQVNQARAGYLPKLNVSGAYGRERSKNRLNSVNGPDIRTSLWRRELGIELRQNVFHGFDTWYEMKRTKAKTDADSYLVCAAAEDQALLATRAYISVMRDRELVQVARRNLASHESYHSIIKKRSESGVGREADIHQINGRLALAKSNLAAVENDLANSEALFYRVSGIHPAYLVMPATPSMPLIPRTLDEATTIALRYHPKMRTAVVDVEEARAQHNVSHRTAFPVLDLVAAAQNDRNVNGVEGPDKSYRIMGELQYNLYNGGADVARQRETAYLTQEAAEVRNRTCRQVIENLRLSWNAMITSDERLPSLKDHSKAAQSTLDSYNEQFKLSKRSLLDVLDTENERFAADSDFIRGVYDALFSRYRVVDAMGQLANYLDVTLPKEAREVYNTYEDIAGPARSNRQYDAGLEHRDFPSRYYHKQEPVHKAQPCLLSDSGVVTRRFSGKPLNESLAYKGTLVKSDTGFAHRKNKPVRAKASQLSSADSGKWLNTRQESQPSHAASTTQAKDAEIAHDFNQKFDAPKQPAEKSAAKVTSFTKNDKSWAVKVGSFTSDKEVEKSIATLQDKGFDGYVKEIKTPDQTTTEVYVGPTKQRSSAENLYTKLMNSNISGRVVSVDASEGQ